MATINYGIRMKSPQMLYSTILHNTVQLILWTCFILSCISTGQGKQL